MKRRKFFSTIAMSIGSVLAYGLFIIESFAFLMPKKGKERYRKIFAGTIDSFPINKMKSFIDPSGNDVLVKRTLDKIDAFSTVCPHLGCKVHWEDDNNRFFCPCHGGVFNSAGEATAGPPFDDGQDMIKVPLEVDNDSGIIYVKIKESDLE